MLLVRREAGDEGTEFVPGGAEGEAPPRGRASAGACAGSARQDAAGPRCRSPHSSDTAELVSRSRPYSPTIVPMEINPAAAANPTRVTCRPSSRPNHAQRCGRLPLAAATAVPTAIRPAIVGSSDRSPRSISSRLRRS